jgi:hypothetical protein
MLPSEKSANHISGERLFEVVTCDGVEFVSDEFQHLKCCELCLDRFSEFIRQKLRDRRNTIKFHA